MATINMNLTIPVVGPGGTQGPTWATDLNTDLDLIDLHDHSTGKGVKITPAGININQDFSINSYQLTSVDQLGLINKTGTQPTAASRIYEFGGELFFNDGSGNQVQLTSGGAIDVSSLGTITGDYSTSTADLSYVAASKDFVFRQSATLTANISSGPIKIYRNVVSSPYSQIQLNAAQAGNLDWTLPSSYPGSTLPFKSSTAGVMSFSQIANSEIADGAITTVKISDGQITTAKYVDASVTNSKIGDGSVTRQKMSAVGQQISASENSSITSTTPVAFPNLTVTITTTGRPIFIMCQSDGSTANGNFSIAATGTAIGTVQFRIGTSTVIASYSIGQTNAGTTFYPSSSCSFIHPISAGTYTINVYGFVSNVGITLGASFVKLIAYEL